MFREESESTTICLTVWKKDKHIGAEELDYPVARLALILLLLVSVALFSTQLPRPARALTGDQSVLYVSPGSTSTAKPLGSSTPSFSVNVNLNLSSTDSVSGYDIYMSYNDSVLKATGLFAGDLFPPDRVINASYCITDVGYGCGGLDTVNTVHWSVAYVDGSLSGPLSRTVFRVQFSVLRTGHSFLQLFSDTINGAVDSSGIPPDVVHVSWNGVYTNNGLQAFFNVAPAILLINNPVYFDASTTFNPDNSSLAYRSSLVYIWDFGDGMPGIGVTVRHTYSSSGTYNANLLVTDYYGRTSSVSRIVTIVPALGGLRIGIKDMSGNDIVQSVTLKLYSGYSLMNVLTRHAGDTTPFVMSGLAPGIYRLDFSGSGITPASKQENVVAGVTKADIVYLTLQTLTHSGGGSDLWVYLFFGSVVSVLVVGTVSLIPKRLKRRKDRPSSTRR